MKKNYLFILIAMFISMQQLSAAHFNIVTTSSFTFSPATTNATVGDTITIGASSTHPTVQVDLATWNANGSTPMVGGWGTKTSSYTFTIMTAAHIYFVCANHVSSGM